MNHKEASHYLEENVIQWTFNVERAPWWGGVFEGLIRSVKRCLRKVVGRAKLTREELLTVVTEVEMIVNSQPLSYVSHDDLEEPVTPSHLLIERRVLSFPDRQCYDGDDEDYNATPQLLSMRMKYFNHMIDEFWSRWNNEKRRGFWNLGKIEDTIVGADREIRCAVVRVFTGETRSKLLKRPIQKLFPLEVNENDNLIPDSQDQDPTEDIDLAENDNIDEPTMPINNQESGQRRSKRAAAITARDSILVQSMF
uniref:DUF5641 domain-containing protein n=1 Tax=Amphimedon queenslandica TaxID=400682 RepID=A0A1X7UPV8_AMPQE